MSSPSQIPHMHSMSIFAAKEQIRLNSILDHVRSAPFAAEQRVESQVPPKIVMQKLIAAVDFPLTEDFECFAIEHENAARAIAIRISKRAYVNGFGTAVNGMRARIIRARENFFRLDDFNDFRFSRVGLRVDYMNPRGADPGHNQITPFNVWMRRVRTQRGAARVPPEMMQLIAKFRHPNLADALAVRGRLGININNQQRVVQLTAGGIQRGDERVFFRRSLHCQAWRRIKRGIRFQQWHKFRCWWFSP